MFLSVARRRDNIYIAFLSQSFSQKNRNVRGALQLMADLAS